MFDANLRHLKKGSKYFAKVHSCHKGSLFDAGVKYGDILQCEMLSDSHQNPLVKIKVSKGYIKVRHNEDFYDWGVVYEGQLDGTDFINEESKRIAMAQLKENTRK